MLAGDLRDLVVVEEGGWSRHAGCGIGLRPDEVDGDPGRLGLADGVHGRRRLHRLEGDAVHALLGDEVAHDLDLHVRVDLAVDGSRFGTAIRRDLDEPVGAGSGAVAGRARAQCRHGRLDDVRRCVEIGLADLEMDDVLAATLELLRAGQYRERAFGAEPLGTRCEP